MSSTLIQFHTDDASKIKASSICERLGIDLPPYYDGSRILDMIAPGGEHMECAEVPVKTNFADTVPVADGIAWKNELMEQQRTAYAICEEKDPDRIIVLGGDCSVEQAPFDYLHGKYPEDTKLLDVKK